MNQTPLPVGAPENSLPPSAAPGAASSLARRIEEAQGARQRAPPPLLAGLSQKLCRHFLELHPRCPFDSFAFFLPLFDEPDLFPLARAWRRQGATACLPSPLAPGEPLSFWPWDFESPLEPGAPRMRWPAPLHRARSILPELILVPCALFDESGRRAGYGQGLYESTMSAARSSRPGIQIIGCSLEWSRSPVGSLPGDPTLDGLATDDGYFDTARLPVRPCPADSKSNPAAAADVFFAPAKPRPRQGRDNPRGR